jgi:hypothetical protein
MPLSKLEFVPMMRELRAAQWGWQYGTEEALS